MIRTMAKRKKHPKSWAKALQRLRLERKLTQAQAAVKAGVAIRTWIAWENAQTVPSGPSAALLRLTFPGAELPAN